MEISGIDRLLSYALQLGVKPNRVAEAVRPAGSPEVAPRPSGGAEDGVRVSLSSRPTASPASAAVATTAAPSAAQEPLPSPAPRPARIATDGSPAGKVIDAYQRNAPAELGSRIRIRA